MSIFVGRCNALLSQDMKVFVLNSSRIVATKCSVKRELIAAKFFKGGDFLLTFNLLLRRR